MSYTFSTAKHKQDVVIIFNNGEQEAFTLGCGIMLLDTGKHVLYPRSIFYKKVKYVMFKYKEEQDVVFYRETKKG